MERALADKLVAGVAGVVLLLGAIWSFQAAQQPTTTMDGSMMDSMMNGGTMTSGTDPLVSVLAAILIAVLIGGGYLFVRDDFTESTPQAVPPQGDSARTEPAGTDEDVEGTESFSGAQSEAAPSSSGTVSTEHTALLQYLPDDERRVLEPVIDSPGVTQIEIRDRANFSKSKVSQTLSELEGRGLIYKEKQGRTFRVYPGEELDGSGAEQS